MTQFLLSPCKVLYKQEWGSRSAMGANTLETSVPGEVKLSRKREMSEPRQVERYSWGAEEKREMFGVKTERFVPVPQLPGLQLLLHPGMYMCTVPDRRLQETDFVGLFSIYGGIWSFLQTYIPPAQENKEFVRALGHQVSSCALLLAQLFAFLPTAVNTTLLLHYSYIGRCRG